MFKKVLLLTLVISAFLTLLTACSDVITTTPAVTEKPTTTISTTSPTTTGASTTSTTTTTGTTTTPSTTTSPTTSIVITTPASTIDADSAVAARMVLFMNNIESVQNYYDDGLTAMATLKVEATKVKAGVTGNSRGISNVPQEFKAPLPAGGKMPAPAGACPAAAKPDVTFKTVGGDTVTPQSMIEKAIKTVPTEYVTMAQDEAGSLLKMIEGMVQLNDQRLATKEGWNELLWNKLKVKQTSATSLMDYQMWNAASDIETQISDLYYQRLAAAKPPQIVLDAYKASNTHGWFASTPASDEDALAQMQIAANMTGTVNGLVHEQRDFSIPGASQTPKFSAQTGNGTVTWDAPGIGKVAFDIDINLDKFDDMGRAVGGKVIADAIGYKGYQVRFNFKPDGSKDGVVFKDGVEVGYLTMTVDHEKFENYIDIKQGTEIKMPDGFTLQGD
jgi:hypothetical protein